MPETIESFKVKTSAFEGPLDLLLTLIEKRKLFINDISLSKVTDDFIAYIQNAGVMPMADSAQFILIASTLLLIKSRSLLPSLTLTEEEEESISDLETRLKIYQRIKDVSVRVKEMFGSKMIFFPLQDKPTVAVFSPHESQNLLSLAQAIKDVIKSLPKKEVMPKAIVRQVVSLEEMIDSLSKRITSGLKMKFSDIAKDHKERVNVIVSFLAMLELVKQGIIYANQENNYGDIHMETREVGIPRYN